MIVCVCFYSAMQKNAYPLNTCITFIQRLPNVSDSGHLLYKCYANVLYLLSSNKYIRSKTVAASAKLSKISLNGEHGVRIFTIAM